MKELIALLDGHIVGRVTQKTGKLTFSYDEAWRSMPGAYPLSTSMSLFIKQHSHSRIEPFLWGLLPDNELVLQTWAKKFQVSPRSAFDLIANVGEDCAGAIQFVLPERLEELMGRTGDNAVEWLNATDIEARLRHLRENAASGRTPEDTGQFSLAGAQPKTALYFHNDKWGVPSGRVPTTHIFKPPTGDFDGFAENEHLCLSVARALGLPTAKSEILKFGKETAIVVERYDRQRVTDLIEARLKRAEQMEGRAAEQLAAGDKDEAVQTKMKAMHLHDQAKGMYETSGVSVLRVHQEDYCQALGVHPADKYQNMGGPSPLDIIEHLRNFSAKPETDVLRFIDALIFNWLIGGTDAHAKNYSILIGSGRSVRLAPLYDIASILAYRDIDARKAKLAMKVGDAYKLSKATMAEWIKFSNSIKLSSEIVLNRIGVLAEALPDALSSEVTKLQKTGLDHPIIPLLQATLSERATTISKNVTK